MKVCNIFRALGSEGFAGIVREISIGKLKTYQVYERLKIRSRLPKLNQEGLRKGAARFWERLGEGDEDLAADLAQAILVSRLDVVVAVLDYLGIAHEEGFFQKNLDASHALTEGWQQRAVDNFRGRFSEPLLVFYVNHLAQELTPEADLFKPAGAA